MKSITTIITIKHSPATMLLFLSMLSGILLISNHVTADSTEVIDQVSLTVPIACTMAGTGTTHTATLNPGTYSGASGSEYENGIGKTTLTAICNDDNGFSIYAIGYTGNSYDSENHTKLVGSNTGGTISTKAYTSGDTASNWSMKLTKVTDATDSYNPQNLTIQSDTEGIFSNWHSIPDTYTKVAEYHANTGSSTTDTTLGVKLETTYAAYIAPNQPADTYIGQVKYTMVHPYNATAPSIYPFMQNVSEWGDSVVSGQEKIAVDSRDNNEYTVARLADGYLWMTRNLRLDFSNLVNSINVSNTHNPTASFMAAANDNPLSSNVWCTNIYTPECPNQLIYNSSNIGDHTLDSFGHTYDEYGVYYNWYTATAGNGTLETADEVAEGDICPYGWHLPTQAEYSNLDRAMGGTGGAASHTVSQWTSSPASFVRSGTYYGNSATRRGEYGEYFSARAANTYYADKLYIMPDEVATMPGNYMNYKYIGTPIRCIYTE